MNSTGIGMSRTLNLFRVAKLNELWKTFSQSLCLWHRICLYFDL